MWFTPRPKGIGIGELNVIIRDVLLGVRWLHSHGFVHRDIRWANIIKETNGRVRLIDLEHTAHEGPFVGPTLVHWPALPGGEYRKTTDLYLVGRLVEEYTCLSGQDADVERFTSMLQRGISVEMALQDLWVAV